MAIVKRYVPVWTAGSGGLGTSTFHFDDAATGYAAAVRTFFSALVAELPTDVSISFPSEALLVDVASGELVGTESFAQPGSVTGTSTQAYAAPSGARVRWQTPDFVRGRRVTGATFIVPLRNGAYDLDGTLAAAFITTLGNAANTLRGAVGMQVYSRPQAGLSNGSIHGVTGSAVPDRVAILRSRRD